MRTTSVLADIRYACRNLLARPLWTLSALACLAIGTGANTASLSVINAILLRPLPFPEPARIATVVLRETNPPRFRPFSLAEYREIAPRATLFSALSARTFLPVSVAADGPARMVQSELVSENYFAMLGVSPLIGRFFEPGSDPPQTVLSERLWKQRFGGDPSVLGRRIRINGRTAIVSGVTPAGFIGATQLTGADLWIPESLQESLNPSPTATTAPMFGVLGRLAPGVSHTQAQLQLDSLVAGLKNPPMTTNVAEADGLGFGAALRPIVLAGSAVLFGLIGLIMAVAVANVAGLMLARVPGRRPEIGVRLALGATRARIARLVITESLVLGIAGSLLGVVVATALIYASSLVSAELPEHLSYAFDIRPDWRVMMYAACTAIVVSVLFGLVPARQAARTDLIEVMKQAGTSRRNPASTRALDILVVGQLAISAMLLVGCAMLARTYLDVRNTDSGMDMSHGLAMSLDLNQGNYSRQKGLLFYQNLLDRASSLPGVEQASLSREVPLTLGVAQTVRVGQETVETKVVTSGHFATLKIPFLQGRDFSSRDESVPVAVVNETMASRFWPGRSPLGQILRVADSNVEITGVVKDVKYRSLSESPRPVLYRPLSQDYSANITLIVRSAQPDGMADLIRKAIQEQDPDLAVVDVRTLEDLLRLEIAPRKRAAALLGTVCGLGLLLSAVGLYGVVAFGVRERTREFGLRVALGAHPRQVLKAVLARGIRLSMIGFAIGLIGAFGVARVLTSILADVAPLDLTALSITAVVLVAVALVASYFPARWATQVDPADALRSE